MEIVNKEWKIVQTERGDGTAVVQVFKGKKVVKAIVCDAMSKQKLTALLKKTMA